MGSYTTDWVTFSDGETLWGQVVGTDIAMYNANEIADIYISDSTHTSAGKAMVNFGSNEIDSGNDITTQEIDNFEIFKLADTVTGWNSPTTNGEVSNDFTNPSNANSCNDSDATSATVGNKQDYGDFGFDIRSGDTVRGIMIKVESDLSGSGWFKVGVEVSNDNGTTWSSAKIMQKEDLDTGGGDVTKLAGHGQSLWGLTWTPTDVSDADFRVRVEYNAKESGNSRTLQLDCVQAKILHDAGTGGSAATTTNYIHTDHLGGTNVVTDDTGEFVEVVDYYPFGEQRISDQQTTFEEQRKFTGHEYESDSDLTYAKARYYNQDIGKWLSQDSVSQNTPQRFLLDPQQLNTYSYTRNNPLILVDPSGEVGVLALAPAIPYVTSFLYQQLTRLAIIGGISISQIFNPLTGKMDDETQSVDSTPYIPPPPIQNPNNLKQPRKGAPKWGIAGLTALGTGGLGYQVYNDFKGQKTSTDPISPINNYKYFGSPEVNAVRSQVATDNFYRNLEQHQSAVNNGETSERFDPFKP